MDLNNETTKGTNQHRYSQLRQQKQLHHNQPQTYDKNKKQKQNKTKQKQEQNKQSKQHLKWYNSRPIIYCYLYQYTAIRHNNNDDDDNNNNNNNKNNSKYRQLSKQHYGGMFNLNWDYIYHQVLEQLHSFLKNSSKTTTTTTTKQLE